MPVNAAKILKQADDFLTNLEDAHLAVVDSGLRLALRNLEKELKKLYPVAGMELKDEKDQSLREKRARALVAQLQGLLKAFDYAVQGGKPKEGVPDPMKAFIYGAYGEGIKNSAALLKDLGVTNPLIVTPDTVAIQKVAQNSAGRLSKHTQAFIDRAQSHVIAGLVTGKGFAKVSSQLAQETGILRYKAERIVRTESISANDEARRAGYKANGIKYVQRTAANDRRVCGYCAARHGRVYPIDQAPASIHPNDRCANMPFRPEWVKDGLIDLKKYATQRDDLIKKLKAAGVDAPLEGLAPFERNKYKSPPQHVNLEKLAANPDSKISIVPLPPEALAPTGPKPDPAIASLIEDIRGIIKNYPGVHDGKPVTIDTLIEARRKAQDAAKTATLPPDQEQAFQDAMRSLEAATVKGAHNVYTGEIEYARYLIDTQDDVPLAKLTVASLDKLIEDWGIEPTEAQAIKILELKQDIVSAGAAKMLAQAQADLQAASPMAAYNQAQGVLDDPDATPLQKKLAEDIQAQADTLIDALTLQQAKDQLAKDLAKVDTAIQAGNVQNAKDALDFLKQGDYESVPALVAEYQAAVKVREDQIANLEQAATLKLEFYDLYNVVNDTIDAWANPGDTFDKADAALNQMAEIFTKVPQLQTDLGTAVAGLVVTLNSAKSVAGVISTAMVEAGSGNYEYALALLDTATQIGPTFNQEGYMLNLKNGYEDLAKAPTDPFQIAQESADNALASGLNFAANTYVAQMKHLASTPEQEQLAHEYDVKVFTAINGYPPAWANPTPPTPASPGIPQTPNANPQVVEARLKLDAIKGELDSAQVYMEHLQTQYQDMIGTKVKGSALVAKLKQEGYTVAPEDFAKANNAWTGLKAKYAKAKKAYQKALQDAQEAPSATTPAILDWDAIPGDKALTTALKMIATDQSTGFFPSAEGTLDNLIWEVQHGYMEPPTPEQAKILKKLARKQDAATGSAYENVIPQASVTTPLPPATKTQVELKLNDASYFAGVSQLGPAQANMGDVATLIAGYTIDPDLTKLIETVSKEVQDAQAKAATPPMTTAQIATLISGIGDAVDSGDLDGAEMLIAQALAQTLPPTQLSFVKFYQDAIADQKKKVATPPTNKVDAAIQAIEETMAVGQWQDASNLYFSLYVDWAMGVHGEFTDAQVSTLMDAQDEIDLNAYTNPPTFLSGPPLELGKHGPSSSASENIAVQNNLDEAESKILSNKMDEAAALIHQAQAFMIGKTFPQFIHDGLKKVQDFLEASKAASAPATPVASMVVQNALQEALEHGKATGAEKLIFLSPDGTKKLVTVGKAGSTAGAEVDPTPETIAQANAIPNLIIVHNHPLDLTFSVADFKAFAETPNWSESHIVLPDGSVHTLTKPPSITYTAAMAKEIIETYNEVYADDIYEFSVYGKKQKQILTYQEVLKNYGITLTVIPPPATGKKAKTYPAVDYKDPTSVLERIKAHADQGDYIAAQKVMVKAMQGTGPGELTAWIPYMVDLTNELNKAKLGPPGATPGQQAQIATLTADYEKAFSLVQDAIAAMNAKYGDQVKGQDAEAWKEYLDFGGDPQDYQAFKILLQNATDTAAALQGFVKGISPGVPIAPISTAPAFPPSEAEVQAANLTDDQKLLLTQKIKGYQAAKTKLREAVNQIKNDFGLLMNLTVEETLQKIDDLVGQGSTYAKVETPWKLYQKTKQALQDAIATTGYGNTVNPPPAVPGPSGTLPTSPPSPVPYVLTPVPKGGSKKFEAGLQDANAAALNNDWGGVSYQLGLLNKYKPNAAQMNKYHELATIAAAKGEPVYMAPPTAPAGWTPPPPPPTTAQAIAAVAATLPPAAVVPSNVNSPFFNEAVTIFEAGVPPPNGEVLQLNGVKFEPLASEPDWKAIPDKVISEPALPTVTGSNWVSSGIIVMEDDGRVWVYRPTNGYGGVSHTYPKGRIEADLTPQQNALKELYEEAGLTAEITGYMGDYVGTSSTTRYYVARRTGGAPWQPSAGSGVMETESVKLATPEELEKLLNQPRDLKILADIKKYQAANPPPITFVPQKAPTPPPPPPRQVRSAALVQEKSKRDPQAVAFPGSLDDFEDTGKQLGGSTGARLVKDKKTGKLFIMKRGGGPDPVGHLREEMAADAAYQAMGVPVPAFREYTDPSGKPVKVAEFIEGTLLGQLSGAERAEAEAQYLKFWAADVAMGNWDVIGASADNVLWDKKTRTLYRIDNGGSFRKKAMGGDKETDPHSDAGRKAGSWSQFPFELWTLRQSQVIPGTSKNSQVGPLAGRLSWGEISDQMLYLARHRDAILAEVPPEVRDILKQRIDMMGDFGIQGAGMVGDKWNQDHVEEMTYHRLQMKYTGVSTRLAHTYGNPRKHKTGYYQNPTVVEDENGKEFDNLRGSNGEMARLKKYMEDAGVGSSFGFFGNWMRNQGHDSWDPGALAMKWALIKSRGGDTTGFYWRKTPAECKADYDRVASQYGGEANLDKALSIWKSWQYEMLSESDFLGNDRDTKTVRLIRTEGDNVVNRYGLKMGETGSYQGGACESASIYHDVYVFGEELQVFDMPYWRIFGSYFHSNGDNSESAFAGDDENEFNVMLSDIPADYWAGSRQLVKPPNQSKLRQPAWKLKR